MPEAVIDGLEVVQVDEQHAHHGLGPSCPDQRGLQVFQEQGTVRQAGQVIVQGSQRQLPVELAGRFLRPLALRDLFGQLDVGPGKFGGSLSHPTLQVLLRRFELSGQSAGAQVCRDPGQDLLVLEGFGDVVQAARLETPDLVLRSGDDRHEEHRDLLDPLIRFQPTTDLETVDARQQDVQQDQVWVLLLSQPQPSFTVSGDYDLKTVLRQVVHQNR
jgi:hypothetical protein